MVRFIAVESLLLGYLLSLAATCSGGLWARPGLGHDMEQPTGSSGTGSVGDFPHMASSSRHLLSPSHLLLAAPVAENEYTFFWVVTLAVLLPQGPAVLAHNQLDWASFWSGPSSSPELSQITVGALFLLSLVLLVTLQRVAELRRLRGELRTLHLESGEQGNVIASEILALVGLVASSLVVTAMLLSSASALARMDYLLAHSPWTVLTIGAAALAMVTAFLHLWMRTRQQQED